MSTGSKTAGSTASDPEKGAIDPNQDAKLNSNNSEQLTYNKAPWYLRVPFAPTSAPPPRGTMEDAPLIPEATASVFSILTFEWMTHILALGYARPLTQTDVYRLQDDRSSVVIASAILASFEKRRKAADEYNAKLASGEIKPGFRRVAWWTVRGNRSKREKEWREKSGLKKPSLVWAMNDSVKWWFWSGGILKVISDVAQVTSPLVVKAIIKFAQTSYLGSKHVPPLKAPHIGEGMGLAVCLFLMQLIASFGIHHCFYRSASTGVLLRGGLITAIYSQALRLTSRARGTLTNGKLINHISTDISRIDLCAQFFHMGWTAPIQMVICLILLLLNLGPSALAGFGFFILATPVQTVIMKKLIQRRKTSMQWTDKRAKLLQELLGGMRILKFFAWENPFLERIAHYRSQEIKHIRTILLIRSGNNALAFSLPVLASVVAFVAYALSGHTLDPAIIFASLTLFSLLRMPLMFLPMALGTIADAINASSRLQEVFIAETFDHLLTAESGAIDPNLPVALEVVNASFTWDAPPPSQDDKSKKDKNKGGPERAKEREREETAARNEEKAAEERIFKVQDIDLVVPRGQLCAIVGSVGAGKSSLLQGLIGEMRCTGGTVKLGGSVGYCPQSAWIQNATIRENVLFGSEFDEERYWSAIHDSCLERDLELLPNGDMTEVGEKGISLSGGQKQRLSICRALYSNADILIFDDPLSALDAHVGKSVFNNVLLKNRSMSAKTTRVLVTHGLHFLPQVDYIYTMVDGRIAERGTYKELMVKGGAFAKFVSEFGGDEQQEAEKSAEGSKGDDEKDDATPDKKARINAGIMQAEERNVGAVSGAVYKQYLQAANGRILVPVTILSLVFLQGASVMASYWLVYWQEDTWHRRPSFYMIVYACLGISQALGFFCMGASFATATYFASKTLHRKAIQRIMHAPMSFFETTPLGRIMNRFAKDIDTIDNALGEALRMFFGTFSNIIAAAVLISIVIPYFLVPVFFVSVVYYYFALFYRSSARELKRLDAILRSSLYSHFSESLSGLATIRAYGEAGRFKRDNEKFMDNENRAYWLTVTNQRWLGIRLDLLGTLLTFLVAVLAVAARFKISPAQTGVTLSYILLVQQSFGWMVRQSAEVENDMNAVERILHYSNVVEQESPNEIPDKKPPSSWPARGEVEFRNVVFKYRPNLPVVLRNLSMSIAAGEKIGIVGRTGAGKSSIMIALFRLVELTSGSIFLDGVDISTLGLDDVRKAISIIPQDPLLFSGTLRTNLDPFGSYDDAVLWDALKRAYLVDDVKESNGPSIELDAEAAAGVKTPVNRFSLDMVIEDEGANLSVGQRSLVTLARAIVKNSKVIVLDEATASVDYETDSHIQDTIATEFHDRTILCIAHRLRTIIGYDRICVMDAGEVAEFDTPVNLYQKTDGIFRGMCEHSNITLEDIRLTRKLNEDVE